MTIDDFCGEVFFDSEETLNSTDPRFSNCFTELIFDLIPSYYLWLLGIPYFLYLHGTESNNIPVSKLFKAKSVLTILLWLLAWIDLFRGLWEWGQDMEVPAVDLVSPLLIGVSMALAYFFINYERLKGMRNSGYLLVYWLLTILMWVFPFKSKVQLLMETESLSDGELLRCITFFISYAFVIANFVLSWFNDLPPSFIKEDVLVVNLTDEDNVSPTKAKTTLEKKEESAHMRSPELSATFLSRISFWWFTSMVVLGYKRPLETTDLWKLTKEDEAGYVARSFLKNWKEDSQKFREKQRTKSDVVVHNKMEDEALVRQPSNDEKSKSPSLTWTMCKTFGPFFLLGSCFKLVQDCLTFVNPQLLKMLINFTIDPSAPLWQGYILAVGFFITAFIQSLFLHQYFHICFVAGMRLRSAIVSSIYRKSLLLSNAARKSSTVGEVVNLMSVDAQRFMDLMTYLNIVWSGPFQIIFALYFLWNILGPSVLAGLAVMILLIPVNAVIANKARALQVKQMKYKDERIKLMNEILNGIKVLKLYAWETSFQKKILDIRNNELKVLRSAAYLNAASSFTWVCAPFLVSLTTFAVYVLSDPSNVLTAEKAFVSLSLFNIMKFPISMLPMVISALVQASVSLNRLNKFMNNAELDLDAVDKKNSDGPAIIIENGTFTWEHGEEPVLEDINCEIKEGSLVAVVGQVGSGKSSLISALLGDTEKTSGYVKTSGTIAYVAQQAWIQNATVRDNILFGRPLNVCDYQDVIENCELKSDFDVLPGGDMTEIGEKGINLSGGQKQRVSVARAVYQDAQIYLFDDPLSAVDAHVGKNIFENVIGPRGCLRKKTRVLVTHGIAFLPLVDNIIVLKDGRISEVGSYYELQERDGAFAEFLRNYANTDDEEMDEGDPTVLSISPDVFSIHDDERDIELSLEEDVNIAARKRIMSDRSRDSKNVYAGPACKYVPLKKKLKDEERVCKLPEKKNLASGDNLIVKETAETGRVKLSVYLSYAQSIGILLCMLICILYAMQNAVSIYSSIWLSDWSNDPVINGTQHKTTLRLSVYGVLGLSQGVFVGLAVVVQSYGTLKAASHLHRDMLCNLLRAPMQFYDQTPIGRIINRFSKDVDTMDNTLPRCIQMWLTCMFKVFGAIIAISFATPLFIISFVPLIIMYYFIQRFYVATSRQLKRLESISRSPIYSHFGESVTGASTIRAYGLQRSFILENEHKVDLNQMAYYPNIVSNRWLALRLEFVGNCIVLFAAIFAVAAKGSISGGIVGLSISYALQITQTLNWMVRQTSELETNIVAVERVKEYSEIEGEASDIIDDCRPPHNWPKDGTISFRNYSTRYRKELDLVVKDIEVNIKGGEKIGIVGRTGAGKSSLTLALFRIIEPAGGSIFIDDMNISKIGLFDLRSKLSIIPQDPVLFSGTLRMNLDPFDAYTDDQLWNALEHSHLKPFVSGLPKKLEHDIAEGGENLSVGQRQLVCLARALLRHSKILVLDEATAAVDLETDDLIQGTIRVEFEDCTTFTIAHRLNTIMDSTRVLVLDAGKVAEFDTPINLLKAKGIFYGMAKDAGLAN
uniref:multidrug resistance-associated protein 1-like isoform X3 n=1 Tax=Styela clava TaxID=7725 RepID=UPI00193A22EB|nr:multidrug resistance-associated protein 1-like isoform X3 [Styela clava]